MGRISRSYGGGVKTLWTLIVALTTVLLLFLTIGIVALRMDNSLPAGENVYFIVPKNPSTQMGDDESGWKTQNDVSIFSSQYVNGENQTTVLSQNGDNVIAPGAISKYSFYMRNGGNMAVRYDFDFAFILKIAGVETKASEFPLSVRMTDTKGNYVMGSASEWLGLDADKANECSGILGANSYEQFDLEIMWAFEGHDELDTMLGNESAKSSVELTFHINSYAEEHFDATAQGGVEITEGSNFNGEYGGEIRWEWFAILLAALALCTLYLVIFRM